MTYQFNYKRDQQSNQEEWESWRYTHAPSSHHRDQSKIHLGNNRLEF